MHPARSLLALLILGLGGAAVARCVSGPSSLQLTIRGFGTATFEQLRTDTAHDLVEFYGGVCVAGQEGGWTLRAARITVTGLRGELAVSAEQPTLEVQDWRLQGATLHATRQRLAIAAARLQGKQISGTAATVVVNLVSGAVDLTAVDLHGATFFVRGTSATLTAGGALIRQPVITSCGCAGPPLYAVTGSSARVDAQGKRVVLRGGQLRAGAVRIPLSDPVTLDEQTLQALKVPVKVAYLPAGTPGAGLGVTVGPLGLAPGVHAEIGLTGLDAAYPLGDVALLRGSTSSGSFTFGKAAGGMRFESTSDSALTPWLDAGFDVRVLEPGNRDTLREGVLHARAHTGLAALHGQAALQLVAAASSQTPAGGQVAGARLDATASATIATGPARWGRVSFDARLYGDAYPGLQAAQWGVDLEPGYSVNAGPLALQASYLARFSNAGSPFSTTLDRLEPIQRPALQASLQGALAPAWSGFSRLAAQYDLVGSSAVAAGLNRLDVSAGVAHSWGAWSFRATGEAVLAGIVQPDGVRDGYLQGDVDARRGGLQFGARARYRYAPGPAGLDLLELSAAVPIEAPGVELRPYLALDFAPTVLHGEPPAISGHGLELTFITCCGALTLGYRDQDGTWTVSMAVDLQRRATAAVVSAGAAAAPACTVASGATGIMASTASGPPAGARRDRP